MTAGCRILRTALWGRKWLARVSSQFNSHTQARRNSGRRSRVQTFYQSTEVTKPRVAKLTSAIPKGSNLRSKNNVYHTTKRDRHEWDSGPRHHFGDEKARNLRQARGVYTLPPGSHALDRSAISPWKFMVISVNDLVRVSTGSCARSAGVLPSLGQT